MTISKTINFSILIKSEWQLSPSWIFKISKFDGQHGQEGQRASPVYGSGQVDGIQVNPFYL